MSKKAKIDKNSLPEGFTVPLALIDALPVVFFSVAFILFGVMIHSPLFIAGSSICLVSGSIKVLWKLIVATKKKNVWWMFVQMRIAMPIGFLVMLAGFIVAIETQNLTLIFAHFSNIPCFICLCIGLLGIILMVVFSVKLDPSDLKSNWIEQGCNSIAQLAFLLWVILAMVL